MPDRPGSSPLHHRGNTTGLPRLTSASRVGDYWIAEKIRELQGIAYEPEYAAFGHMKSLVLGQKLPRPTNLVLDPLPAGMGGSPQL